MPGPRPPGFYPGNYAQVAHGMASAGAMNAIPPYNAAQMMFPVVLGSVQSHMQMMGGKFDNQPPLGQVRTRPPPPPPPPQAPFQYSQGPSSFQAAQAQLRQSQDRQLVRPDILDMSYDEYIESFHRFQRGEDSRAVKGMEATGSEDLALVRPQQDVDLMSEEDYLEYCRKYTAQMGMPFDEEMVRRHYHASRQALQGTAGQQ
jgi:hypothetical protein